MTSIGRGLLLCVVFLLLAGCAGGCGIDGRGSSEAVVARVGATPITKRTLEHWTSVESGSVAVSSDGSTSKRAALGLLIEAEWTVGEARELGVAVTDAEAREGLALLRYTKAQEVPFDESARDADFVRSIGRSGETTADAQWLMKLNLLALRLERRRLQEDERAIGFGEIARYYAQHRRRFVVPEQRDLEVLGNDSKAVVDRARREIAGGADFVAVAKRMSTDSEAPQGLQLHLQRGQEEPEYENHVFAARPGVLLGPIHQVFYYLFRVLKVTPPRLRSLAQSEASIRATLVSSRKARLALEWRQRDERRWTARTDCSPGYVVAQCRLRGLRRRSRNHT